MSKSNKQFSSAFTIVELLIVIVIIGILAAITIVSYTGINGKANIATIQTDLANASKKINMYYALYGVYPTDMINNGTGKYCPTGPTPDTNYCVKPSSGTFFYSAPTPSVNFSLRADSGSLVYTITKDTQPTSIATTPITAIAATTGTAQIGQTLTAGAITPSGATVSYQWQAATTASGTYSNIAGATNNNYVVSPNVMGKYIKVVVTGTGSYSSNQTSAATAQVPVDSTNWIVIGGQTWAKANQNVGTMITGATAQTNNGGTNSVEKYCYNNTESNCTTYGGLYQWDEAMKYSTIENSQGICPAGAHIPSDNEWKILEIALGMTQEQADIDGDWRGTDQGTQLKSGGSSGLNVQLAGFRFTNGTFSSISSITYLWSSSAGGNAYYRHFGTDKTSVYRLASTKAYGYSVRCLGN